MHAPADDSRSGSAGEDPGLLGGLPRTRPSLRTNRRAQAQAKAASETASPSRPAAAETRSDGPAQGDAREPNGFEQLARASVVATTGTAAAGIRLAGRAAGGLGRALRR